VTNPWPVNAKLKPYKSYQAPAGVLRWLISGNDPHIEWHENTYTPYITDRKQWHAQSDWHKITLERHPQHILRDRRNWSFTKNNKTSLIIPYLQIWLRQQRQGATVNMRRSQSVDQAISMPLKWFLARISMKKVNNIRVSISPNVQRNWLRFGLPMRIMSNAGSALMGACCTALALVFVHSIWNMSINQDCVVFGFLK